MTHLDFGLLVRGELFKRGMTHRQLADTLGISAAYLSDILNGRRDAPEQRKKIIKLLNIKEVTK